MALAKIKKNLLAIIIGGLIATNLIAISLWQAEKGIRINTEKKTAEEIENINIELNTLKKDNISLSSVLDYKINSSSTIGAARKDLVKIIQESVEEYGRKNNNPSLKIDEMDAIRALKSSENRILDEYIRMVSLVLATMNVETNFTHKVNENINGTKDYGIMQVNEVVIPHIKEALGEDIDPINNKSENIESGSWEIYDCYNQAKEKHPEDVIWWTYAYYNRGKYFENSDVWKNPKNPNYNKVHKQANIRSNQFKKTYEFYHNELIEIIDNEE